MIYTKKQVSEITGFSERTVERWASEGVPDPHGGPPVVLPVLRISKRGWRTRREDLVDFLSRLVTVGEQRVGGAR